MINVGLYCTVNSDDPPMFSTDLNHEYRTLAEQSFTWDELWKLKLNGLEAAFLPADEKIRYRQEWRAFELAACEPIGQIDCRQNNRLSFICTPQAITYTCQNASVRRTKNSRNRQIT